MLDSKTSEILGNEMVGGRPEILQEGGIGPSSEKGGQGVQEADHETAIESNEISEIAGENEAVNEVTETEELTDEIGIETETVKYPARPISELKKIVVKNVVVNEVTETEDLPDEIGIETETGGIKTGRKAGETKTGGKGTGNGIGQEVVLPKGILPVPANRIVVGTVTNTKRVNETRGKEVKIRTETISKKR